MGADIYKSLLFELSQLQEEQLVAVSSFIDKLKDSAGFDKAKNREANLAVLSEKTEWKDEEFEEYRQTTKSIGEDIFKSHVEW